jgi:alanyl aminopeptidase
MMKTLLVACLLVGVSALLAQSAPPGFLLPKGVVPRKHTIEMTIDPSRETFTGVARIEVQVLKPERLFWVNGKDLSVQEAVVEVGKSAQKAKVQTAGGEFIGLEVERPVPAGTAILSIRYQAPLSDTAVAGPYRRQVGGDWYMFTVFTPIDARRAFPCYDEPDYKTPWEMSIRVKSTDKAFANGPMDRVTDEPNGMKLYHFAVTQPLPAEVVAFAVGPFDEYDGGTAGEKGTPVHVITAKGHGAEGKQAALATHEILPRLEKYMGLPYPYTKLYHIALPAAAFGATENPGLITYQSRSLLVDPGSETPERLTGIRRLQTHEVSHQWFGNLVTQSTWEDVYLSEGFATWITAKLMDQEQPTTRKRLSAVVARERIMAADAGLDTHPVRWAMKSREDLYGRGRGVYNQIAYQKGAAVILMLEGWLGEAPVQKGVQQYLKAHSYGNAASDDVAAALRGTSGTDPKAVMHSFLDQTGIPTVHFEMRCDSAKPPRLLLEQANSTQTWTIPVCWTAAGMKPTCTVLETARREVTMTTIPACPAWVYPNAGGTGYYRSDWTAEQLAALAAEGLDKLSAPERLTLAYDVRAQQKAGRLSDAAAQPILEKLASDPEPEIANAAKGVPAQGRGRN